MVAAVEMLGDGGAGGWGGDNARVIVACCGCALTADLEVVKGGLHVERQSGGWEEDEDLESIGRREGGA